MRSSISLLVLFLGLTTACTPASRERPDDEAQLRALHEKVLRAHRERDIEMLLEDGAAEGIVANRGVVNRTRPDDIRERLGPYLATTRFDEYRDLIEPIVSVSEDGTLGWVIAQVYARGRQATAGGKSEPLEFTCAWIELYERRGDRWLRVGNVSNFKE